MLVNMQCQRVWAYPYLVVGCDIALDEFGWNCGLL